MRHTSSLLAAVLLAFAVQFAAPRDAAAQAPEVTAFQDWSVKCVTQAETGARLCEMTQIIFADEARTQRALLVVVGYPRPDSDPGMLLVLPLGISLPSQVFLQIDQGEPQPVPVERCEANGCIIELLLAPDYLNVLKAGSQATVYAHDRRRKRFAVPFSLLGFTAGLTSLTGN